MHPREGAASRHLDAIGQKEWLICSGVSIMPNRWLPDQVRAEGRAISIPLVLVQTMVLAVFLGSIAGFLGKVHHSLELLSHFPLQYLMAALTCLLLLVALHAWWSALLACFMVVLNLVAVLPWYIPPSTAPLQEPSYPLKLLSANVESRNKSFSDFIRFVLEENPDVVIIQEATEPWIHRLQGLEERFPYHKALPRPRGVGIALYSRLPVAHFDVIALGSARLPGLLARFTRGGGVLSVVAVHPRPPHRRHDFRQRNEQLRDAAAIVQALPAPKILVGDLNTSLWSPYYAQLIRHTGLSNARQGFGVLPTWPTFLPAPLGMIPIDHCLVSPDIRVLQMSTGRHIGSDHLPIVVDLVIPG
jgi:endonuclease/exonuclease/phosphatase (EEP) superfamily protein YafD